MMRPELEREVPPIILSADGSSLNSSKVRMAGSCIFRLAPYAWICRCLRTLRFNVFFESGRFRLPWLVEKKSYSIRRKVIQSIGRAPRKFEMSHQSSEREEGIRIWFATAFPLDTCRHKCWVIFWQFH